MLGRREDKSGDGPKQKEEEEKGRRQAILFICVLELSKAMVFESFLLVSASRL